MSQLTEYAMKHAVRGECMCGLCADAVATPEKQQPIGHTSDLIFFKVAQSGATKEEFLQLVKKEYPSWLDGREHNYIEIGAEVGDQGLALMIMGLGDLLDAWKLFTPKTLFGENITHEEEYKRMAGLGLVIIQHK